MEIYTSYTREDATHGSRLKRILLPSAQMLGCQIWSMQDIVAGRLWQQEMGAHLRNACLFVPLVSADFMADQRCQVEVVGAIQLEKRGLLKVLPVLLRPCMWEYSALQGFPVLPENRREVTSWPSQDKAWLAVQAGILKVVKSMQIG